MPKVILESWRDGLEKVSLTKIQIELLGKSLKESKSNVDALLENKKVTIAIDDLSLAQEFLSQASKIGVNCKIA